MVPTRTVSQADSSSPISCLSVFRNQTQKKSASKVLQTAIGIDLINICLVLIKP